MVIDINYLYLFFFALSSIISIVGYKKTNLFFNPISLFSLSLFFSIISVFVCDKLDLLRSFSSKDIQDVVFLYIIALIGFIIPWIAKQKNKVYIIITKNNIKKQAELLSYIIIICLLLMIFILRELPILSMLKGTLSITDSNESLKDLPLGISSIRLISLIVLNLYLATFITCRNEI